MNVYDKRRPARVGKKDVCLDEHYDETIHMIREVKHNKKYMICGIFILVFVFIQGLIIGKLID